MAIAIPANFVATSPKRPGSRSDIFHSAKPAPISITASAMALSLSLDTSIKLKSGAVPLLPAPPPPALPLDNLLISSNPASCFSAFFAAAPVPSIASVSLFSASAATFESSIVLPVSVAKTWARAEATWVSMFTSVINTGMTISTSGWAMVSNAPFNLAIAAVASELVLITFPIQLRIDLSAAVMSVNTKTRRARPLTLLAKRFSTSSAFFRAGSRGLAASEASAIFLTNPPAESFISSSV